MIPVPFAVAKDFSFIITGAPRTLELTALKKGATLHRDTICERFNKITRQLVQSGNDFTATATYSSKSIIFLVPLQLSDIGDRSKVTIGLF